MIIKVRLYIENNEYFYIMVYVYLYNNVNVEK